MDKIEEIIIQVTRAQKLLEIDISVPEKIVMINGIKSEILPSSITRLYSIIRTWKDNYNGSIMENSEFFRITIKEKEKSYCLEGAGEFPENYSEFKNWLGDIGARNIL